MMLQQPGAPERGQFLREDVETSFAHFERIQNRPRPGVRHLDQPLRRCVRRGQLDSASTNCDGMQRTVE